VWHEWEIRTADPILAKMVELLNRQRPTYAVRCGDVVKVSNGLPDADAKLLAQYEGLIEAIHLQSLEQASKEIIQLPTTGGRDT
jgi:hypothetical protein